MRKLTAHLCIPVMRLTGFRFGKDYRWGTTLRHRVVYACVDVVFANQGAS